MSLSPFERCILHGLTLEKRFVIDAAVTPFLRTKRFVADFGISRNELLLPAASVNSSTIRDRTSSARPAHDPGLINCTTDSAGITPIKGGSYEPQVQRTMSPRTIQHQVGNNMDPDEMSEFIERMEKRIEAISNQNASLTLTLNKLMMENMKLKADIKNLEEKLMLLERPQAERNFKME